MGFGPEITAFLESGCALILAAVGPDGEPYAARGWGMTVLSPDEQIVRLLLDIEDAAVAEHFRERPAIAVTAANVRNYRSVQLKGVVTAVEPAIDADRARADDYTERFFSDVEFTDKTPRPLLSRIAADDYVAVLATFTDVFDQTPGPVAGRPIEAE